MKYTSIALAFCAVLSACSSSEERPPLYLDSQDLAPLKYPEALRTPSVTPLLEVPAITQDNGLWGKALEAPPEFVGAEDQVDLDEVPVPAPSSAAVTAMTSLQSEISIDPDSNQILTVQADLDDVFPRIDPAAKRLGFQIDDSSRGLQSVSIYREIDDLALASNPNDPTLRSPNAEKRREEYQIQLKVSGKQTEISIRNKDGKPDGSALAQHLLVQLQYELGHPVTTN